MIGTIVAICYKDVFDGFDEVEPLKLLHNIPTLQVLRYVAERQHEVVFAFSDFNTHTRHINEMSSYIEHQESVRVHDFIGKHRTVSLFSSETSILFYKLALHEFVPGDRTLSREEISKIYEAYLYCNQIIYDKPLEGLLEEEKTIPIMSLRVDLPIVEFKLNKDFQVQMYKGAQFFKFCERDTVFSVYLNNFIKDRKCHDWKHYILRWFNLLNYSINNIYVEVTEEEDRLFFDQYRVDVNETVDLWKNNDQYYLRNKFLYSPKEGLYILLNFNLLVDKFYQGMLFDFCDSINRHGGPKFDGKTITYKVLHTMIGKTFSETYVLYDLFRRTFDGIYDAIYTGDDLYPIMKEAEPDFYMRKGSHIFLFEFKDLTLGNTVKYSNDTKFILEQIESRICKGGSSRREGGGQLAHSINAIINEKAIHDKDKDAEKADVVYPILITTDRSFSALGVNYLMITPFAKIINQYSLPKTCHIAPLVIFDYDTMFAISTKLHNGSLELETIINEYTRQLLESPHGYDFISSFHTFAYDNYRRDPYTHEDIVFLFSNFFEELERE